MTWQGYLDALAKVPSLLDRLGGSDDALLREEAVQQLAMLAAQGYLMTFAQDPRHPQFVSYSSQVIKVGAPNPDFMYYFAAVEGGGVYRLSGTRGTSLFVHLTQNTGVMGADEQIGPVVGNLELDELHIGKDGAFAVVVSAERPAGHNGDWWKLDPRTTSINVRQASMDWEGEVDARMAIERLDKRPAGVRLSVAEIDRRLVESAKFADRFLKASQMFMEGFRKIPVNTLTMSTFATAGGLANQSYYNGPYEIAEDEALIVETDVPGGLRYWSILLVDDVFNGIDWVNNQSTLNGFQAKLDKDGRFRAVVSVKDPGVPNWLDPAGHLRGLIQGRWLGPPSPPTPTVKRVKLAEVRKHLPTDTPTVTADQRDAALRARRRGAQFRRKW